jgi:hypothetical protein
MQILIIKLDLDRDRQLISAVYLSPAGQPRHENMNASLSSERDKIILIKQGRARSNKTQVVRKNAPQLRQFVETRPAKEATYGSQINLRIR